MRFQEDGKSEKDEQAPCGRAKGFKGQVPKTVLPSQLFLAWTVRVTDLSSASRLREAVSLLANCSFTRGFFLISLEKNEAQISAQEQPWKPGGGRHGARALPPCEGAQLRKEAPGCEVAALWSPSFVLPASTELPKFEGGSLVSSGYSLHSETPQRQHNKTSLPFPFLLPPTPASTNS